MSQVKLIFGRKKKGKGTLSFHLADSLNVPIYVYDPNNQFHNGAIVSSPEDFESVVEGQIVGRRECVIYRPIMGVEKNFDQFARVLASQRGVAVIVDEAARLMGPQGINDSLDDMLRAAGDHQRGLDMFLTQHRPQDVNGIAFEMADVYIFFSTKHPLSLKQVERYCSAEAALRVSQLREREYLEWSVETEDYFIEKNSDSWFEHLGPSTQELETMKI